jgi:hypothetical protein
VEWISNSNSSVLESTYIICTKKWNIVLGACTDYTCIRQQ